ILCVVSPQNWSFLKTYTGLRQNLFNRLTPIIVAELGAGAFDTPLYDFSFLLTITERTNPTSKMAYTSVVTSEFKGPQEKAKALREEGVNTLSFNRVLNMPDMRLLTKFVDTKGPLSDWCDVFCGIQTGDNERFVRKFWEMAKKLEHWEYYQRTTDSSVYYGGMEQLLYWEDGSGEMSKLPGFRDRLSADLENALIERRIGFVVHRMGRLPCTIAHARLFDQNGAILVPKDIKYASSIWKFITSPEYYKVVRSLDNKVGVTPKTLAMPSFNCSNDSDDQDGRLPQPYSDDPTQWIFHGHPARSEQTLQVAVARLLGYRWPAELDAGMELSAEARALINKSQDLLTHADKDGIVCIPAVGGEAPAAERLLNLLAAAYGEDWSNDLLSELLAQADHAGKSLETWLRDKFFVQHCQLFHHRPFIWQIWDGLRDGFSALVNYHHLDRKNLETLIYSYLGDWITRQKEELRSGVDGAGEKLAAAENLKKKLELILEGEATYDIFVRWKSLAEQPIGWQPDLNDGVRLNIRPFISVPDVGKKGAGCLRDKPNIKWGKDRGKDVESSPWYHLFKGDRINDHHLTLAEKSEGRENHK
ncbi:MAG TPA: type II restriction endonuclease subunit M, partial [Cyclobacteriaceae bacterium]|nr:type II restriction endonuclease subunit M [Cyclobacteriaceae bacterium]